MNWNFRKFLDSPIEVAGVALMAAGGGLAAFGVTTEWAAIVPLVAGALLWSGARPESVGKGGVHVGWRDDDDEDNDRPG